MNIEVQGPKSAFVIPIGDGFSINISESLVTGWILIAVVFIVCLVLTKNLKKVPTTKRQVFAEYIVTFFNNSTYENLGHDLTNYAAFIATVFIYALLGALISLLGFRSMTADINVTATWAIVVFVLITYHKIKANGIGNYLKGFINPLNIIGEIANPASMAIRLFGNVAGGMIITSLLYAALGSASAGVYGLLGFEAKVYYFNIFQIGIPAVLSVYFDLFSGAIQSYVFIMLTMAYIKSGRE